MKVGVMGAGAIGCYVGGQLAATGHDVVFVGRQRIGDDVRAHGLTVIDLQHRRRTVAADRIVFATDASALADCDVVLCAVKSGGTADAAAKLAELLGRDAVIVSLQNGIHNAERLREALAPRVVLGGIVGFNVISREGAVFQRTTSGPLVVEAHAAGDALSAALLSAGFEIERPEDIAPKQWSKLMMNLNNAVSALSGAPTRDLVLTAGYRKVLAAVIEEALRVLRAAKIRPARLGALPVHVFPYALRLPTPIVKVVARAQLKIDPEARSSMWEDLEKRRLTEVDYLNGEIVALAKKVGTTAPLNERIVALVHDVEARGEGSPKLSPEALWKAIARSP